MKEAQKLCKRLEKKLTAKKVDLEALEEEVN
jgi:hypothetical protein